MAPQSNRNHNDLEADAVTAPDALRPVNIYIAGMMTLVSMYFPVFCVNNVVNCCQVLSRQTPQRKWAAPAGLFRTMCPHDIGGEHFYTCSPPQCLCRALHAALRFFRRPLPAAPSGEVTQALTRRVCARSTTAGLPCSTQHTGLT